MRWMILGMMLLTPVAAAFGVDVHVAGTEQSRLSVTAPDNETGPATWSITLLNNGSTSLNQTIRLTVRQNNQSLFQTWSRPLTAAPGEETSTQLSFYTPRNATLSARFKTVTGNATPITQPFTLQTSSEAGGRNAFSIGTAYAHGATIHLPFTSPESVETAYVSIIGAGRRFEQTVVQRPGLRSTAAIRYAPTFQEDTLVTVIIWDGRGQYYTREKVQMNLVSGVEVWGWRLRAAVQSLLHMIFM